MEEQQWKNNNGKTTMEKPSMRWWGRRKSQIKESNNLTLI
jgi:hypothetical protein